MLDDVQALPALVVGAVFHELLEERLRLGDDPDVVVGQLGLVGDELDGVVERAQPVHQAELEGLLAGVDAAAGQVVDRLLEPVAADRRDVALEDAVDLVHPGPHLEPLAGREDVARGEHARVLAAAVRLEGDAELVVQTGWSRACR